MSPTVIAAAAMIGTALPLAWWSVSADRSTTPGSAAELRRGFSSIDLREQALRSSGAARLLNPLLRAVSNQARRLTPADMTARIETRIAGAGLLGKWSVEQVLAAKLLLALGAAVFGVLRLFASPDALGFLTTVVAPGIGWIAPDVIVGRRAEERKARLLQELPDVLDQITIAVEAGLGFESALARVASSGDGVLAEELARTLQDIQLGVPRSDALKGLAERTDVPELRHLVGAIRQAERYGLRIAKVLRINAGELREKRRQAAEEQAQKLPVKILFPLIFFILPALFVVILGPAVVRIANGGLGG